MLRFHLDENSEHAIAEGLRRHGFDVTSTPPDVAKGTSDPDQLAWCVSESRVIISQDSDMLRAARSGVEHAGVAYYRPNRRTYGQLIGRLINIGVRMGPTQMKGHVEYL